MENSTVSARTSIMIDSHGNPEKRRCDRKDPVQQPGGRLRAAKRSRVANSDVIKKVCPIHGGVARRRGDDVSTNLGRFPNAGAYHPTSVGTRFLLYRAQTCCATVRVIVMGTVHVNKQKIQKTTAHRRVGRPVIADQASNC